MKGIDVIPKEAALKLLDLGETEFGYVAATRIETTVTQNGITTVKVQYENVYYAVEEIPDESISFIDGQPKRIKSKHSKIREILTSSYKRLKNILGISYEDYLNLFPNLHCKEMIVARIKQLNKLHTVVNISDLDIEIESIEDVNAILNHKDVLRKDKLNRRLRKVAGKLLKEIRYEQTCPSTGRRIRSLC